MATELVREVACVREQDVVERIKEAVVPVLTKHGRVVAAYLFGSAGTERATAMSDVDIAVLTDGDISLLDELSLSADVAVALGREDVDLLVLNSARNDLQHAITSSHARGSGLQRRTQNPSRLLVRPGCCQPMPCRCTDRWLDFGIVLSTCMMK
ncbi:MAG TPA: hypothetical protein DCL63_03850 [Firmicutes bacterium]|nr:hypothetical protein [Bacillota bacterium]